MYEEFKFYLSIHCDENKFILPRPKGSKLIFSTPFRVWGKC